MSPATNDSSAAVAVATLSVTTTGRPSTRTPVVIESRSRGRVLRFDAFDLREEERPVGRLLVVPVAHRVVVLDRRAVRRLNPELGHHVVVLVDQVVAVDHVAAGLRAEARDHLDRLVFAAVDDVLRALLERLHAGALAARAAEDLEVDQVNVDRVEPAAAEVLDRPDLYVVEPRSAYVVGEAAVDDLVPRLAVDRPVTVLVSELERAMRHRARLSQRHRIRALAQHSAASG